MGRNCCVHVGSAAIFRRSRHAAPPATGHSQLSGLQSPGRDLRATARQWTEGRKPTDPLRSLPVGVDETNMKDRNRQ